MISQSPTTKQLTNFFKRNKKSLLLFLVLAGFYVALVCLILPEIEERRQNEIVFRQGRLIISRIELESSQKLERLLLEPFPAVSSGPSSASPSSSPSVSLLPLMFSDPKKEIEQFIHQKAIERIIRRKILEQEAGGLKIDLAKVKNETVLPAGVTAGLTDDGRFLPLPLFSVFAYDKNLLTETQRRVEGWGQLTLVSVSFSDSKLKMEAEKIAQNLFKIFKDSPASGTEATLGKANENPAIRVSFIKQTTIGTDSVGFKSDERAVYASNPFGYEYSFRAVSSKDAGLGANFEEWYGLAKEKYIENQ